MKNVFFVRFQTLFHDFMSEITENGLKRMEKGGAYALINIHKSI